MLRIIIQLLLLITVTVCLPPYPAKTDCDGVTCIPNPGNCQPSYEKDTCCPVWYCHGRQGGVFTSFGKSEVSDNGFGSSVSQSAISSSNFKGVVDDGNENGNDPSDEAAAILNGLFSYIDQPNRRPY